MWEGLYAWVKVWDLNDKLNTEFHQSSDGQEYLE